MPSTAIISPQIIDSTQIGRDLITAADQAAAQAIIGVTGVDVSADYTWTGDHTFQGSATFDAGVETAAITTATNLVTTLPSGGQGQYYFGLNPIYLMSATEFRPAEALTVATLGSDTRRWTNVYSVDGSFSGNLINEVGGSYKLYNLGTEGDADTEYLETSFVSNVATIAAKNDGSGTARGLTLTSDGTTRLEGSATRLYVGALLALNLFSSTGQFNVNLQPASTGTKFCGSTSRRWSNVASVDGDFSGTTTTAGFATGVQTITAASDTLVNTDHTNLCDCTSNAITINLPAASAGQQFVIKKIDSSSNAVTIDGFGSETIDGGLTAVINTQYESVTIISDGSNWFIV